MSDLQTRLSVAPGDHDRTPAVEGLNRTMVRRASLWPMIAIASTLACGEGTVEPPPVSNEPAQVEIQQADAQLLVGNELPLTAEVRTALGTVLPTTAPRWTSNNPTVATVDEVGVVLANSPGQALVFATAGLGLDSVGITVPVTAGFVSSAGGVVQSPDGKATLTVPAGAVSAPTLISIAPAPNHVATGPAALPGAAFEFGPQGLFFANTATLSIQYDRATTNPLEARRLRLHKLTSGAWLPVGGSTVDTSMATVSGPVASFSFYAAVAIPNAAPVATITGPADGSEISSGLAIDFAGGATDAEDGALSGASLVWSSSVDGALGTGASVVRSDLSFGAHVVTLTATDGEGVTGTAQVAITIVDGPPVVQIAAPSVDTVVKVGDVVVFQGSATDHVEGAIPGDSLTWTSSLDGVLGTGAALSTSTLSLGDHVITLTASDSQGQVGTAAVLVSVKANSPPVVTIVSPGTGASIGDASGTTLQGTADDPEDGPLSGGALVWTSSVDGTLGSGTSVGSGSLTIGNHVLTLTATDSDGATASASVSISVFDEPPTLFFPMLSFVSEAGGALTFSVTNSATYSTELFVLDAAYPVCTGAPTPSRTWVEAYDGNGVFLARFCDFNAPSDLSSFTFTPAAPVAKVYIELWDRATGRKVRSASITPVPSTPTVIEGLVANDRDADLNTQDPGESLSGVGIHLIVDGNGNGVIDAGEATWATTSTNGSGAYSFTNLWPGNYIVRAISPSNVTVLRALSATGAVVDQTGTLVTTAVAGAGATLNQSGTNQVGTTDPAAQGDEFPRWGYSLGTAAPDTGLEPSGPGPNSMNGALTTAPAHFTFLYKTGGVSGRVTTGSSPVPGARVIVTRCQTAPSEPSPPAAGGCTQKHGVPSPHIANVDTDANGAYSVSGLLEGVYQIEVAPQTAGYTNVVVPAGPSTYLAVLRGNGDNAVVPDFSIN